MTPRVHFKPEPGKPQGIPELVGHMLKDKSNAPSHINYVVYPDYHSETDAPQRKIVLGTTEHGILMGHNKVLNAGRLTFMRFADGVKVVHLPISFGHPTPKLTPEEEIHVIHEFIKETLGAAEGKGMAGVRKKPVYFEVARSEANWILRQTAAGRRTPIPGMGAPRKYKRAN